MICPPTTNCAWRGYKFCNSLLHSALLILPSHLAVSGVATGSTTVLAATTLGAPQYDWPSAHLPQAHLRDQGNGHYTASFDDTGEIDVKFKP
jgi:hypothetical protein